MSFWVRPGGPLCSMLRLEIRPHFEREECRSVDVDEVMTRLA